MKFLTLSIFISLLCLSSLDVSDKNLSKISEIRDYINSQTVVYETNIFPDRNKEASIEFGGILFTNNVISQNRVASCSGSNCHAPSNQFAPIGNLQGGQGIMMMDKGMEECKFFPKNLSKDIAPLNTPQIRGLKYKSKTLSKGQATKEEQASSKFGLKAHFMDVSDLDKIPLFQYYGVLTFQTTKLTEQHFIQAILDYENSLDQYNEFTEFLDGARGKPYLRKGVTLAFEKGCFDCHQGKGGVSELKGTTVLNHTGTNATDSLSMVRSWHNSNSFERWFWNASYKSNSIVGLKKHMDNEGIFYSGKEAEILREFIRRGLN